MSDWGRTLTTGIAAAIEQALNRALALDPASGNALKTLLDEPLLLKLQPPGLDLYLSAGSHDFRADSRAVNVQFRCAHAPALTLTGSPLAFAAVALGDGAVFRDGRLCVDGDVGRAHRLQHVLQQLDPDWEASLADIIGGVPAHFVARRIRQSLRWAEDARGVLTRNIEEYIQEENDALPARAEAEAQFEDIDVLRLDVDRLEARLRRLEGSGIAQSQAFDDQPQGPDRTQPMGNRE